MFTAVAEDNVSVQLAQAELWAYKYDTLSVPPRALAQALNESAYPPCVLYREACSDQDSLPLRTVFFMLDELIDAIDLQLPGDNPTNVAPLVFSTKSAWIDRIHHVLVSPFSTTLHHGLHHAYHFAAGDDRALRLCAPSEPHPQKHSTRYRRPFFCTLLLPWNCSDNDIGRPLPIWSHIAIRCADLQREHPDLQLDLTVLATQRTSTTRINWDAFVRPEVYLRSTALDITTWIRGRRCARSDNSTSDRTDASEQCETVLVSDYRYELESVDHNATEWRGMTGVLRIFGQVYVWVRLVLLFVAAYKTRIAESGAVNWSFGALLTRTLRTFLLIPAQALVFGSWPPVLAHAIAHAIDGCVIHLSNDNFWATLNGAQQDDVWKHIVAMTIQMRNSWYITLVLQF
ncbi:TPA: hypothetical protein N0F65_003408 [Lagenidium giganteum]|uniref:Uncharacterized protein n=1 Tax=Lagenidium giganteum TaxID=4803 RepID=A0AAV2YR28_9STRA|nr:TPA: hypothetical protein N0F65_003408 [Lagenidium giganteum]